MIALRAGLAPWVLVRLRQAIGLLAIIAAYLCTGAAWKIGMVMRHPPAEGSVADAIRSELRPYKGLPVGYALGPSFGRLAAAMRLATETGSGRSRAIRESARITEQVAVSGSAWASLAQYNLAAMESAPGLLDTPIQEPTRSLIVRLDGQRFGRSSTRLSGLDRQAVRRLRSLAERDPRSPVCVDALNRLADLEDQRWEFAAAATDRATAVFLDPVRGRPISEMEKKWPAVTQATEAAARAYYRYLIATPAERRELLHPLVSAALAAKNSTLADELGGLSPDRTPRGSSSQQTLRLVRAGRPIAGARVALLELSRLRAASGIDGLLKSAAPPDSPVSRGEIMETVDQLNPARADDPLRAGAIALISPSLATEVVERLRVVATGRDGIVHFSGVDPLSTGLALEIETAPGQEDGSLNAVLSLEGRSLSFPARVRVQSAVLRRKDPPLLRWLPYPGASQYRVSVARELPGDAGGPSIAVSPDWDRHLVWWLDSVRGSKVTMDPAGFVGPASNPEGNGLWADSVYRVMVDAEDSRGTVIASSIGLIDHAEEFFTSPSNWLGLDATDARAPTRLRSFDLPNIGRNSRWRQRIGLGLPQESDPLGDIIESARQLAPPALPGSVAHEPDLTAVPAHSEAAVHLSAWPSVRSQGRGPIPIAMPFLGQLLSAGAAAGF